VLHNKEVLPMNVPVLLLDPTWRIDRVIGVEHACELILERAVVAASEDIATVMHSPSIEVPIPSVVARVGRLYAGEHDRAPACSHRTVRQRDHHICQFVVGGQPCERRGDSVDHLMPRMLGGMSVWENLVASCRMHNGAKASTPYHEMHRRHGWALLRPPYQPTRRALLLASLRESNHHPAWDPYLSAS